MTLIISVFWFLVSISYFDSVTATFKLQILHCNDLHAHFMETDTYSAACPDDFVKDNKCFGGFARLKEAAIEAAEEAKKNNIPSIFINVGDNFQGTPFYTIYKWKVCADLVAKMGFDVMTLGNHEFDDGIENLVNFLKNANTPTICSNLDLESEPRLKLPTLTSSYVKTINGKKIGMIGYLTPDTMQISNTENLKIVPEIPRIRAEAQQLKAAGADIIIAVGHSGIQEDLIIAQEVEEISLVVGGHSHTLLYSPPDKPPSTETARSAYPTWVTQKSGKKVPVVQAYAFSKYLGKLDVAFDDKGDVVTATGNPILLDGTVKKEQTMEEAVFVWARAILEKIRVIKGYTRTFLDLPHFWNGLFECNLCNLVTDALIDIGVTYSSNKIADTWTIGPIAMYQSGGIRGTIDPKTKKGALSVEDLMTILPFDDKMVLTTLRGTTIKKILELNVHSYSHDINTYYKPQFVAFSGLRVVYDLNKPPHSRVKSVEILCTQCNIPKYVSLEDETQYQIFTSSFLAEGGDKFDMIPKERINITNLEWTAFDVVEKYVEKHQTIYPILDNRIKVEGFKQNPGPSYSATSKVTGGNLLLAVCISLALFVTM